MNKIDLRKEYKNLYQPSKKEFSIVDVPEFPFLMIDGHGDPNTNPEYTHKMMALYSLAYTLKFSVKAQGLDFSVMPLEGLWWTPDMADFSSQRKDLWDWTMMVMLPEQVTRQMVEEARALALSRKALPELAAVRFERYAEGLAAQILYLGAYSDEGPTILRLHQFIHDNGFRLTGKHHEIYLGDPRRNPPEKLKTIIRQPMSK